MHLVVSGEGPNDIGQEYGEFKAGTMYFIIDKIIEKILDYSYYTYKKDMITFIDETKLSELSENKKNIKIPLTGKNTKKETAYFIYNAIALAKKADEIARDKNDDVIAILFRDSDGTRKDIRYVWKDKFNSIKKGFAIANFQNGVAMVPNPKSEAWLLCALKKDKPYQNCEKLENRSGNDKSDKALKKELTIPYDKINDMIQYGEIDIDKIIMPSFQVFRDRLESLL